MLLAGGVAIDHPNEAAVFGVDEIRVAIPGEESRDCGEAILNAPMDHHAAVRLEIAGEQDVGLAFIEGGGETHEESGDGKAALAFVAAGDVAFAARIVEF